MVQFDPRDVRFTRLEPTKANDPDEARQIYEGMEGVQLSENRLGIS
jgi:hypothetical protein